MFLFTSVPLSIRQVSCLFLAVLFVLLAGSCQAGENTGAAVSEVSDLLSKAESDLAADPKASPFNQNAVQYLDQVLTLDPGNPQAYVLLYSVVARYSKSLEGILAAANADNYALQLEKATGYRNQTALVVYKYGLDENILYRMDRLINQVLDSFKYQATVGKNSQQQGLPDGRQPWQESTGTVQQSGAVYLIPVQPVPVVWNQLRVIGTF
jgi:hypothetical protein